MKNKKHLLLILLLVVTFHACKISHDLAVPRLALPDRFRNDGTADSTSVGELPWKVFYTDSFLQALIDTGLLRNYDMQVALNNIEAASLLLRQANRGNLPDVAFQINAATARPSDNSLNGLSLKNFLGQKHVESYSASLPVSWEADIWGKIRNEKRAALAAYLQSEEARRGLQTRLVAAIAQGYYNLLILDRQLDIAERNHKLSDTTLRLIQLQYEAGEVTLVAVQQAEAQRLVTAEIIPRIREARSLEENALSQLVGRLPDAIQRKNIPPQMALAGKLPAGLPAASVSRRPDVKSGELALTIANAKVGIAKAQLYPSLRINAAGGLEAFLFSNWFTVPASLFGAAAGNLTQPLLQRRRLKTGQQVAEVERESAVLRFRQTVLTAVREVSDALAGIEQLQRSAQATAERFQTLRKAVRNAQLLFQHGRASYLEVITAQANLLESELGVAAIQKSQLDAAIELYRALGGGWK